MKIIITYNNKNNDILKKNCKKFITSSVNISNFYNINFTKKGQKQIYRNWNYNYGIYKVQAKD